MDEFTQRMVARAEARQKKLDSLLTDSGLAPACRKVPLSESQPNVQTENSPSRERLSKLARKEVVSDSNIPEHANFSVKENISEPNITTKSLKSLLPGSQNSSKSSLTKVFSDMPGSPQTPHKTLNIQKENFNMEIKFTTHDDIRVEVEIEERDDDGAENQPDLAECPESTINAAPLRQDVKSRLQRLGKLYSGEDVSLSSPIHRTEERFHEDLAQGGGENAAHAPENAKFAESRRKRLAALATNRDNWEDDAGRPKHVAGDTAATGSARKSWKAPAPPPPTTHTPPKHVTAKVKAQAPQPPPALKTPQRENASPTKQLQWDKTVLDNLESQGFSKAEDASRLVYKYRENKKLSTEDRPEELAVTKEDMNDSGDENNTSPVKGLQSKAKSRENCPSGSNKISQITQKFNQLTENKAEDVPKTKPAASPTKGERKIISKSPSKTILNKAAMFENSSSPSRKDPALMTVSERKALFEKNKGEALVPKAAFAMAAPQKLLQEVAAKKAAEPLAPTVVREAVKSTAAVIESTVKPTTIASESSGIASKLKALLHQATTISESQISKAREQEKKRELDMLRNRFHTPIEGTAQAEYTDEETDSSFDEDEDDGDITETSKMIPTALKNKAVTFKQSRESLNSLSSAKIQPPPPPAMPARGAACDVNSPLKKLGGSDERKVKTTKRRSGGSGDSPKVQAVLDDVKRIKVATPKTGQLYPCLSDIEASTANEETDHGATPSPEESEVESSLIEEESSFADSDAADTSFGKEILKAVSRNQANNAQKRPILDDSTCSDLSDVLNDMDEYLDEQSADTSDAGPTPPKNSRVISQKSPYQAAHSNSFYYKRGSSSSSTNNESPPSNNFSSPIKKNTPSSTAGGKLPTHIIEGDETLPLMHTVSFYRRQQSQEHRTPIRQVQRPAVLKEESSPEGQQTQTENEQKLVEEKIQQLVEEVCKQQTVISQTSQALNLCCSTIEFSGSSEQVEAERLLLLATQRRQAALHETQRLRIERTLRPCAVQQNAAAHLADVENCSVTVSDITLPLKPDYIRALSAAGGLGHHLLCLIRYAEHVFVTPLVATGRPPNPPPGCVRIPGVVQLDRVYPDFTITLEVYSMQAHEEILPHEVKYHIGVKKKNTKLLTPKKLLKQQAQDSKLVKASIQSPAGPAAVRSPSFTMVGYVVFSIREVNRTQWTLNKVPYTSPLDGSVQMRVKCNVSMLVEMSGFLTMFEDVSGFGAWHRRWCQLKGHTLSYWKYPDDQRKKTPIGSVSLQGCVTETVGLVSRDICARPNTFQLEFVRPRQKNDTNSLVMVLSGQTTIIRHLLSADTKEERLEWCQQFNKAIHSIKSWGVKTQE